MSDLNYDVVMESVRTLIRHWSRRNLTVMGRIIVVKSLLIPKFNHLILSIPNPTKEFTQQLQKEIYSFVWKNKKDKISRDQLSNDFADGGLRLFKIDLFFEALKCTWIRRIVNGNIDEKGMSMFRIFTKLDMDGLEEGAMHTYNIAKTVKNDFWKEVLLAWSKVKKRNSPSTVGEMLKMRLWNNDYVKVGGKEIDYKRWKRAGIHYIADLIHVEENRFLTFREVNVKYGLNLNFLEYNSVLHAIKGQFKHLLQDHNSISPISRPFISFHFMLILKDKKGCKSLYNTIVSVKPPKSKNYWERKLNTIFLENEWKNYCLLPFKCTMDVKLRWFQYRITHRILTTNTYMYKIKQRDDDMCTFCNEESETIIHLLVDCRKVKPIWSQLKNWFTQKLNMPINLQKHDILFGTDTKKENFALNLIIILTKFYIYRTRCQNSCPVFTPLQKEIEYYFKLEKYILLKNCNHSLYRSKWQVWKSLFV